MVKIKLRPSVEKDLKMLDHKLRQKLILACRDILDDWTLGKQLEGPLHTLRSYRVDEYRIIYVVHKSSEVDIVAIGHRKDIYERMAK